MKIVMSASIHGAAVMTKTRQVVSHPRGGADVRMQSVRSEAHADADGFRSPTLSIIRGFFSGYHHHHHDDTLSLGFATQDTFQSSLERPIGR